MLKEILKIHAERYPLMQPADAVKLLYQREFGVGHLIPDLLLFRERLLQEAAAAALLPDIPLMEPLGNGMIRVMLNSLKSPCLSMDALTDACIRTAAEHHGSMERFQMSLMTLEDCCRDHLFGFSMDELMAYLTVYRADGWPVVSHSRVYHDAYHPSYRVVREDLFQIE